MASLNNLPSTAPSLGPHKGTNLQVGARLLLNVVNIKEGSKENLVLTPRSRAAMEVANDVAKDGIKFGVATDPKGRMINPDGPFRGNYEQLKIQKHKTNTVSSQNLRNDIPATEASRYVIRKIDSISVKSISKPKKSISKSKKGKK